MLAMRDLVRVDVVCAPDELSDGAGEVEEVGTGGMGVERGVVGAAAVAATDEAAGVGTEGTEVEVETEVA